MKYINLTDYKEANTELALEKATQQLLEAHFDQLKKEEWSAELASDYGVAKKNNIVPLKKGRRISLSMGMLALAASIALFILFLFSPFSTNKTPVLADTMTPLVHQYSTPYALYEGRKGEATIGKNRKKRNKLYQNKNYAAAIQVSKKIIDQNDANRKDFLILGMSYFNQKDWNNAIETLSNTLPKYQYNATEYDIEWYLSLAYYQNQEVTKAVAIWEKIAKDDSLHYYEKAKALLDNR